MLVAQFILFGVCCLVEMESKPQTADEILTKANKSTNDLMVSTETNMQQIMDENRPRSRSALSQVKTAKSSSLSSTKSCDYPTAVDHSTKTAVSPYDNFSPVRSASKSPGPNARRRVSASPKASTCASRGRSKTAKSTANSMKTAVSEVSNTTMDSGYSSNQNSTSLRTAKRSETNVHAALDTSMKTAKSSTPLAPRDAWASVCPSSAPKIVAARNPNSGSEKTPKRTREVSARSTKSERKSMDKKTGTPRTAVTPGLFGPRRTPKMENIASRVNSTRTAKSSGITPGGKSVRSKKSKSVNEKTPKMDQSGSSRKGTPYPNSERSMDTARSTKSHERKIGALRSGRLFGATVNKDLQNKPATPNISTKENSSRSIGSATTPTVTAIGRTPITKSRRSSAVCTAIAEENVIAPVSELSNISRTGTPGMNGSTVSNTQNETSAYSIGRSSSCNSTQRTPNPLSATRSSAIESVYYRPDMGGLRPAAAILPTDPAQADYFGAQAPKIEKPVVPKTCTTYNIREAEIPVTPNVRAWTPEPKNRSVTPYTSPGEYKHDWTPVPKSIKNKNNRKNNNNPDRSVSNKTVSGKKLKSTGNKTMKSPAVVTAKDIYASPIDTARSVTPNRALANTKDGVMITTQMPDGSFKVELKVSVRVSSESGRFSISGRAPDGLRTSKITVDGENVYQNQ